MTEESSSSTRRKKDEKVSFFKLFTFADRKDLMLMSVGTVCAIANGLSQPIMTLIFGQIINSFGFTDRSNVVKEVSKVDDFFFFFHILCFQWM